MLPVAFAACACVCSVMASCPTWSGGSIESKIAVHANRSHWPTVDHCAVAKICGTANRRRLLPECEGTYHRECGRQNDGLEFHASFPSAARKNEDRRVWLLAHTPLHRKANFSLPINAESTVYSSLKNIWLRFWPKSDSISAAVNKGRFVKAQFAIS